MVFSYLHEGNVNEPEAPITTDDGYTEDKSEKHDLLLLTRLREGLFLKQLEHVQHHERKEAGRNHMQGCQHDREVEVHLRYELLIRQDDKRIRKIVHEHEHSKLQPFPKFDS